MNKSCQRGSAIIMLFIAVGLFAALAYVFMQGSRTSTAMLQNEASKAASTQTTQCSSAINMAAKRLALRGCGSNISYNSDGTNDNTAITDGSCSIYHTNGGGVTDCANTAIQCSTAQLNALAIGASCGDIVYAGVSTVRIYTTRFDSGSGILWNNGTVSSVVTGATSTSDGLTNTNTLVGLSNTHAPYAAAALCRALGSQWYLPAQNELTVMYTNRVAIGNFDLTGSTLNDMYWSSTETSGTHAHARIFSTGTSFSVQKYQAGGMRVRCIRR